VITPLMAVTSRRTANSTTMRRSKGTKRRILPHPGWFAAIAILLLSALVPVAYLVMPSVDRWLHLRSLTSHDPAKREQAVNYVAHHAADDEHVLHESIARLDVADALNFMQIRTALDIAGRWNRQTVGDAAFLRWIDLLTTAEDETSRISAAQLVMQLDDLADDPRLATMLAKLIDDPQPDVRFNAMTAAGQFSGSASDGQPYVALIASRRADTEPTIARHAWIMLGLIDPVHGFKAPWRSAPPPVAAAMIWSAMRTNPANPRPALEALRDPAVDPEVRAMAAYSLRNCHDPAALAGRLDVVEMDLSQIDARNLTMVWRAILSLPRPNLMQKTPGRLEEAVSAWAGDPPKPVFEPLVTAATYQLGIEGISSLPDRNFILAVRLATVESQRLPWMEWPIIGPVPVLLRVMTTAVAATPQPGAIYEALSSEASPLRDLACAVAAKRFTPEQNEQLITELLGDLNDDAKMSGAILAGLTGLNGSLLIERTEAEDVWAVKQIMQLASSMAGGPSPLNDVAGANLLVRDELPMPISSVLLAMLHRGDKSRIAALDYLLNPQGDPAMDLVELFDQLRWWYILKDYLPADAPPFWWWADAELEAFQVDVLRDWYLINRHRLEDASAGP
jgi:HEAT repeat protein